MHHLLLDFHLKELINPKFYIDNGGLWLLVFIVFAETGLFFGFFLPGDSLLFVAGIVSNQLAASLYDTHSDFLNLSLIAALMIAAGILGNTFGYFFGKIIGPSIYNWRDRMLFKKKYLYEAHEFFEKHGVIAVVFARFIPFIRPFAPIVAGIVDMNKKKFGFLNVIGSIAWVTSMLFAGHYLNQFCKSRFNFDLEKHLEVIVLGIVIITTAPVIIKVISSMKKSSNKNV
jgi:membrane-associated protein